MLGKLIKYEFKATYSIHLLMCGVVFGLSVLCGLFSLIPINGNETAYVASVIISTILQMLTGLLMSGIMITTLVLIAVRFYKNLLGGDEGYLMFTLPVSRDKLLWSKLIVAMCYLLITTIVCVISNILMYLPFLFTNIDVNAGELWDFLKEVFPAIVRGLREIGYSDISISMISASLIVTVLLSIPTSILRFYSSVSIGHLAKKHRVLVSFGAYFGFYAVLQLLAVAAMVFLFIFLPGSSVDTIRIVLEIIAYAAPLFATGQFLLHYLITRNVMNKHLNLQ